jgi:hypothetical protein
MYEPLYRWWVLTSKFSNFGAFIDKNPLYESHTEYFIVIFLTKCVENFTKEEKTDENLFCYIKLFL